jgi:hypothetical protein
MDLGISLDQAVISAALVSHKLASAGEMLLQNHSIQVC